MVPRGLTLGVAGVVQGHLYMAGIWETVAEGQPKSSLQCSGGCHVSHLLPEIQLTGADDAGIFVVAAVVGEPATVQALPQSVFSPRALHIVQSDGTPASVEMGSPGS